MESQIIRLPKKYGEIINTITDEEAGRIFKNIFFLENENELKWIEKVYFNLIKVDLENLEKSAVNWKKWWRPKKEKTTGYEKKKPQVMKNKNLKERERERESISESESEIKEKEEENITSVTAIAELEEKEYWKKEINDIQELIKKECISLWIIYKAWSYERQRINNILKGIEYWELCDRMKMTRIDFALNIMRVSTKLSFWNWKIYNAETIYKHYAQVYNEAKKQKEELQKKEMIDYWTI